MQTSRTKLDVGKGNPSRVELQNGSKNNYWAWLDHSTEKNELLFGMQANSLLQHNATFVPPAVTPADYNPPVVVDANGVDVDPGDLPAATITALRAKAYERWFEKKAKLDADAPKFYASIWEDMSEESKQEVSNHADYPAANLARSPALLFAIIRETHLTNVNGAGNVHLTELTQINLKQAFEQLKQTSGVSLGVHKRMFDDRYKTMIGSGVAAYQSSLLAVIFMKSLDPARYGGMIAKLTHEANRNIALPQTLGEMYALAAKAQVEVVQSNGVSVFVCADELAPPAKTTKTDAKQKGKGGKHTNEGKQSTKPTTPVALTSTGKEKLKKLHEWRRCYGCGEKGHIQDDCPDNPDNKKKTTVLTAPVGESDSADADGGTEDSFIGAMRSAVCLFTATEVLWDTQAGQSIFCNAKLLQGVREHPSPFMLHGIKRGDAGMSVTECGSFEGLEHIGVHPDAVANVLSQPAAVDAGVGVTYDHLRDQYRVEFPNRVMYFVRKVLPSGKRVRHYTCETANPTHSRASALVTTVAGNMRRYNKQEVDSAIASRDLQRRMGYISSGGLIDALSAGVMNCAVTPTHVRNADALFGPSLAALKGKTVKVTPNRAEPTVAPRVTQVEQVLHLDVMFIRSTRFLLGILTPLNLLLVSYIPDSTAASIASRIRGFLNKATSRNFDVVQLRADGEGGIVAMSDELLGMGITVEPCGPGQHVPTIERAVRVVKERVRSHLHALPFVLKLSFLVMCVYFCVRCINLQRKSSAIDLLSPAEQFSGRKLDAKRDLRVGFGDYVQATVPNTDNTMATRTEGCIALLPLGNLTGSVRMHSLATGALVTRDQFKVLPMPDEVIAHLNGLASADGLSRFDWADPVSTGNTARSDNLEPESRMPEDDLPRMMSLDDRADTPVSLASAVAPVVGVDDDNDAVGMSNEAPPLRRSARLRERAEGQSEVLVSRWTPMEDYFWRRRHYHDKDFAFTMSVRAALRERGDEAMPVIIAELQQMVDKRVWHGVHARTLSKSDRKGIIRSTMFLKDKYFASGAFEKFKARLVAGGDQQDKGLYENLSSPTAATSSVLAVAAIAAYERRFAAGMDVGGAYLNASMKPTGITVRMRLDKIMTTVLLKIAPEYKEFVDTATGTVVVELDKALYGCVEAAALWYAHLTSKLKEIGFVSNPYDECVFNRVSKSGKQITIALHVDDLLVTCAQQNEIDLFEQQLRSFYPEVTVKHGPVIDYVGMTFDFTVPGEVSVTMSNCVSDILTSCEVDKVRATPASSALFDIRDAPKLNEKDSKYFHTHVAKLLYLAKRVRPECLTAVSFLSTRVNCCDVDDMAKLRRVLGYVRGTRDRGITLKVGDNMTPRAYIDAAYGVHVSSGKSHTGCAIVLGGGGPVFAKSSKQKIVTKSSTEAELVAVSDTATQLLHLRNFVIAQGYAVGPAIIYQDNLSCMALMKKGKPTSERSRHISIRHFWVKERVDGREIVVEHLGTADMYSNVLTKPVQGAQFVKERAGLTNWRADIQNGTYSPPARGVL